MLKKYSIAALFSLLLTFTAFTGGVFAEEATMTEDVAKALQEVQEINSKIYEEIEKAQQKSQELYDKKFEDLGKETEAQKLAEIEAKYEEEIVKLISDLDQKTQQMTRDGIEKAAEAGVIVEIEWVLVQFADREAWIDPIRVMTW